LVPQIIQTGSTTTPWSVACLCAAWCDTCNDYRPAFEALARANPHDTFAWLDIEDESDLLGDIDIENFPTILVAHGRTPHFFGTVLPHVGQLQKLLSSVKTNDAPLREPDRDVSALAARIEEQAGNLR
jgi:thioredoxin 1